MSEQDNQNNNEAQIRLQQAYQKVFSGDDGQMILEDLKQHFWEYGSLDFSASATDLAVMAGEGNVIKYIKRKLKGNIKEQIKQVEEHNKKADEENKI